MSKLQETGSQSERVKKMHRKILVVVMGLALILGSALALAGSTGKMKVMLVNHRGVTINGTIFAKKGSITKKCETSGGTCTLTGLAAGTWAVSAKTPSGAKGGPMSKPVLSGKTVNLTIQVTGEPVRR